MKLRGEARKIFQIFLVIVQKNVASDEKPIGENSNANVSTKEAQSTIPTSVYAIGIMTTLAFFSIALVGTRWEPAVYLFGVNRWEWLSGDTD